MKIYLIAKRTDSGLYAIFRKCSNIDYIQMVGRERLVTNFTYVETRLEEVVTSCTRSIASNELSWMTVSGPKPSLL